MKVRIESDGIRKTRIIDEATGLPITGVIGASWKQDVGGSSKLSVTVLAVPVTIKGEVTRWLGLHKVPAEAMREELARRERGG